MTRQSYLDALLAGAAILVSAGAAGAADHPDFTGLWRTPTFIAALKTAAGRAPPLRPEAKAAYDERVADHEAGDPTDDCAPKGAPALAYASYPLLILQGSGQGDPHWDGQALAPGTFDLEGRAWPGQAGLPPPDVDNPETYAASWDTVVRLDEQPGTPPQERACSGDQALG